MPTRPPKTSPLTRSPSALALAALVLLTAGCAAEDAQQRDAREEVERHVRSLPQYAVDKVQCTDAAKVGFSPRETNEFTCAVGLVEGGCDWFAVLVERDRRRVTVRLAEEDAGCTLGFGD
jgi:hypothetical protein